MPEMLAEIPVALLASMIAKTIFAISTEESRFTLNGALLLLRADGLTMVATDGHRLAMVEYAMELPGVTGSYRALLPRKAMGEILKLAERSRRGREDPVLRRRQSPVLPARRPAADEPQADRQLPGFRARAAQGCIRTRSRLHARN